MGFQFGLAFAFFRLMKAMGMDSEYVDILEKMDQTATVVVFGFFLLTLIRRSFAEFLGNPNA